MNDRKKNEIYLSKSSGGWIQGLLRKETFEVVKTDDIKEETRICGSRFINIIETENIGAWYKIPLTVQNFGDEKAVSIATTSPTDQRFAPSLFVSRTAWTMISAFIK